jgi:TP901 family phage tail tape measure protein
MAAIQDLLFRVGIEIGGDDKIERLAGRTKQLQKDASIKYTTDTADSQAKIEKLAGRMKEPVRSIAEWRAELKKLEGERAIATEADKIGLLNQRIGAAQDELKKLKKIQPEAFDPKPVEEVDRTVKNLTTSTSSLGSIFRKGFAIAGIAAIGTGLLGGMKDFISTGSQYQSTMAEVSAITGVAGKQLDDLGERARQSGLAFGTGAVANLNAYKVILSRLGPEVAQTPAVLQQISDSVNVLTKATGDSADASVDAITTSLLQFGDEASKFANQGAAATNFINVLAAGAKFGAAEVPQVTDAIRVAGVAASNAKVSFVETNAAIQALAQGGKFGAEAGTALRNVMTKLGEGRFLPKQVQAELKNAGVDINRLSDTTLSFTDRLRELAKVQGDSALVSELFGKENSAAAAVLLRTIDLQDDLKNKLTGTNTAFEQAEIRQATFAETVNRLKAVGADVGISLFKLVEPVLTLFTKGATAVGSLVGSLVTGLSQSKTALAIVGTGLTLVVGLLAAGAVKNFFGSFVTGTIQTSLSILQRLVPSLVTQTTATAGATTAQLGLNTAMIANPITALVAGVGLAVAAFTLFGGSTDSVKEKLEKVNEAFQQVGDAERKVQESLTKENKIRDLALQYENLSAKKNKSKEESESLQRITRDLDSATGGAATTLDSYGNIVSIATDRVRTLASDQSRLAAAMRDTANANLDTQLRGLAASLRQNQRQQRELNDEVKEGGSLWSKTLALVTRDTDHITGAVDDARIKLGNLSKDAGEALESVAQSLSSAKLSDKEIDFKIKFFSETEQQQIRARLADLKEVKTAQEEINNTTKTTAKTAEENLLQIAKQRAEEAAKSLEINIRGTRLATGQKFTDQDSLTVARQKLSVFRQQVDTLGLLANKKYNVEADLELKDLTNKSLEVEAKLKIDYDKLQEEIKDRLESTRRTDIQLGIRPPEDLDQLIRDQITRINSRSDELRIKFGFDADGNSPGPLTQAGLEAQKEFLALRESAQKLTGDLVKIEDDRSAKIRSLRIGNIENERGRELALLQFKLEQDLAFEANAIAAGRELSASESEVKKQLLIKYNNDRAAIDKKFREKEQKDFLEKNRETLDVLSGLWSAFTSKRDQSSKIDAESRRLQFDDEIGALEQALARGEISDRQYNNKRAKLSEDRRKFEEEQESSSASKIGKLKDSLINSLIGKARAYFLNLAGQYLLDSLLHGTSEASKTASTSLGTAARTVLVAGETVARLAEAGATGVAAAAVAAYNAIKALPFPIDLLAAGGAVAGVFGLIAGAKKLFGFERGGVIVGEKGAELVQPAKDASFMAVALSRGIIQAVRDEITRSIGGGRSMPQNISVTGQLITRGRDLRYSLNAEQMMKSSAEDLGTTQSLRIGAFSS